MTRRFRSRQRHRPAGTRLDEGFADPGVESHLFVDRFAAGVKLLGVGAFGFSEQLADQMLEHIERLVGQCRRQLQHQGR
jgi:hypothetical protein